MSKQKHVRILHQLFIHPIARNIEWSELIPALSSIGLFHTEKNGSYHFTRNGHTVVFEVSRRKDLDVDDVLKLPHFLRQSASLNSDDLAKSAIVVIDHHRATVYHNPGTASEKHTKLEANLTEGRILHTRPTTPPFHDSNPLVDSEYYELIIKEIAKSDRTVILSHGTGTSNAAAQLLAIMHKKHPDLVSQIVAVKRCDLEAMTEPQLIQSGVEALRSADTIR